MQTSFAPTTGLPELDAILHGVRRGDNIVWQIQSLDEYLALVRPYAEAARVQQRRLIYFRFAVHPPLLTAADGAEIHQYRFSCVQNFALERPFIYFDHICHGNLQRDGRIVTRASYVDDGYFPC